MNKKNNLHQSANEVQASIKTNDNLQDNSNIVKSHYIKKAKKDLNLEYYSNTLTRFVLLSYAQKIIAPYFLDKNKNFLKCHKVAFDSLVSLVRNPETNRGYYNNLITCSNAFCCPICSSRIMGKRSAEIKTAVHKWLNFDNKNTCYMLTLTFAHKKTDKLKNILNDFKEATKRFWRNNSIIRPLKKAGIIGRITSTEIQYGTCNGWHPHQHVLIFCEKFPFNEKELQRHWVNALNASGLDGISDIALNLIEAREAECYLTKISSEMALGNIKQGRGVNHFAPIQLLAEAHLGNSWASSAFVELFFAIRGTDSLRWSRGLKKFFNIQSISDEQITAGKGQPELDRFLHFLGEGYKKLRIADKAMLRNYCASNAIDKAIDILEANGIKWFPGDCDFNDINTLA